MAIEDRLELIRSIEQARESRLICFVLGDRPNMETQIGQETPRFFSDHLNAIGEVQKIDLFLYSRGGHTLTPWRLVSLIREYCQEFSVLLPFRAHSAATMVAIAADNVLMAPLAELTPVDPTIVGQFNPTAEGNPEQRLPISVEDVTSYLTLAKDKAELQEPEHLQAVFMGLAHNVHPLALGNVQRSHSMIRQQVRKLLESRLDPEKEEASIQALIEALTERFYVHEHLINRREAVQDLKLDTVEYPDEALQDLMWQLFQVYEADLQIAVPFRDDWELGDAIETDFRVERAYIESDGLTHGYITEGHIRRVTQQPGQPQPPVQVQPGDPLLRLLPISREPSYDGWVELS